MWCDESKVFSGIFYQARIHAVRQWGSIVVNAQKLNVSDFLSLIYSRLSCNSNTGDKIRAIREFVGLTQSELAFRMKLSRKTISKYENDFCSFKRVVPLKRFADGLSANDYVVTPMDLLGDVQAI